MSRFARRQRGAAITTSNAKSSVCPGSLHTGTTAWYILAARAIGPPSGVPIVDQPVR
jgi:hypothetical protein